MALRPDEPGGSYPFEFVCFRITGYRPKEPVAQQVIAGDELANDLPVFIAKLSGQLYVYASEQHEKVYTIEELANIAYNFTNVPKETVKHDKIIGEVEDRTYEIIDYIYQK